MVKVKLIKADNPTLLEGQINSFIDGKELLSIQYTAPTDSYNAFTALLMYAPSSKEGD